MTGRSRWAGPTMRPVRPRLGSEVTVRIFDEEIQILDPRRMEVIRRHPKSRRAGSLMMEPGDRIFNPSRETDRLLSQAEAIGPHTFGLCEKWFNEEGRSGQRRMYGLVNLVRHYPACYVEKAAELAKDNGTEKLQGIAADGGEHGCGSAGKEGRTIRRAHARPSFDSLG